MSLLQVQASMIRRQGDKAQYAGVGVQVDYHEEDAWREGRGKQGLPLYGLTGAGRRGPGRGILLPKKLTERVRSRWPPGSSAVVPT